MSQYCLSQWMGRRGGGGVQYAMHCRGGGLVHEPPNYTISAEFHTQLTVFSSEFKKGRNVWGLAQHPSQEVCKSFVLDPCCFLKFGTL